jgi:membrane protease YdiL (CAAX protease family)
MKRCPYCGTEYEEQAEYCAFDACQLKCHSRPDAPPVGDEVGTQGASAASPEAPAQDQRNSGGRAWPGSGAVGQRWSAQDAWKFLAMLFVAGWVLVFLDGALRARYPRFAFWAGGSWGYLLGWLTDDGISLLIAAYCARAGTFEALWKSLGLHLKPSNRALWAGTGALVVQGADWVLVAHGLGRGVLNRGLSLFGGTFGPERLCFVAPLLLLSPFCEEVVFRGFLYRAFRGSYGRITSTVLIVALSAWGHRAEYCASWVAALGLTAFAVLECCLRENSDSLWDCVLCHAAFNLVPFLQSLR